MGSSIFGSQTANTYPTNPYCCFCILGDPAERLKGIEEQGGRHVVRGAGGRLPRSDLGAEHSKSFPARQTDAPKSGAYNFSSTSGGAVG